MFICGQIIVAIFRRQIKTAILSNINAFYQQISEKDKNLVELNADLM